MAQKKGKPPTTYVDRSEVTETFADSLENWFYDGTCLRMEFAVVRWDEPAPPKPPEGRRYPVCRLVMPRDTAVDIFNKLQQFMAVLEEKGMVQRESPIPAGTKPN